MTEVFICDYVRTPIGKYGGALASVRTDDLAATVLRALVQRNTSLLADVDLADVDEVYLGCANQAGEDNRNVARMALLLAGLPETTPGVTLNRLCASGMDAVGAAARAIRAGEMDLALAGGVESMTRAPLVMGKATEAFQRNAEVHDTTIGWRFVNPVLKAQYGIDSMPETGENVAEAHAIGRLAQDNFALRSQQRAAAALAFHSGEIVPVTVPGKAPVIVTQDEHPRPLTTADGLAQLKPFVRQPGTVTAGNASGLNDGAAALLLASRAGLVRHGLVARARILGMASAGVAPRLMGIGPVPAVRKLEARLGMGVSTYDCIELNEAFASQALACLRALGLPDDAAHVNANGGAIALGHPLGMTGARLVGTLMRQLEATGGKRGLATLCVGVGQGVAMAIERTS
jgi:3-oxoadipyl-CoA thiolase